MSQVSVLVDHFKQGQKITSLEALMLCGSMRLAARIKDIEKLGHIIDRDWITVNDKKVKQYWLRSNGRLFE